MFRLERLAFVDGPRLRAIRLRAVTDAPDAFDTTFEEYAAWPEERWTAQLRAAPVYVAVKDGADVGMVRCARDEAIAWLVQLWVDPQARCVGIGRALIDAVIEWASKSGVERLLLDVGDSNTSAIALYRSRGFEPNGNVRTLPPPREHVREHQMELIIRHPPDAERHTPHPNSNR